MNSLAAPRRPLVPEDMNPVKSLGRAAWAAFRAATRNTGAADQCAHIFPNDLVALHLLRAAPAGANTTTAGWAAELAQRAVAQWLPTLAPASAAAALIERGIRLPLGPNGMPVVVPMRSTAPAILPWVAEQGGIPVRQYPLTTAELNARKMAVIVVLSRELAAYSAAQSVFEGVLREEAAFSLDAAYFSTAAGSASVHAGLLNGVTPLAATAGGGSIAMLTDLTRLAAAVSIGGSGEVIFIAGPGRASAIAMRSTEVTVSTILPSAVVPEDRIIAADPMSLIHGFGPEPTIDASEQSAVHLEDTTPVSITTGAPSYSMFQSGNIALRLLLDISFAKRRAGAVSYVDAVTW